MPYERLPDPTLQMMRDHTPLSHFVCQKMGPGRVFHDVVVWRGTFTLEPKPVIASEQRPVVLADELHEGTVPEASSLREVGDLHLPKPGADIIVTGTARPFRERPERRWRCAVEVARGSELLARLELDATGPRRWEARSLGGIRPSEPEPTVGVPIRYELAYGGRFRDPASDPRAPRFLRWAENPSGTGFAPDAAAIAGRPAPQWEHPGQPVSSADPGGPLCGFGPVARHWRSRSRFGGTADAAWERKLREDVSQGLVPDYPADFDARFFHCAHPALRLPAPLAGGETVTLLGMLPDAARFSFEVPSSHPRVEVLAESGPWQALSPSLDLVHVDLDARRVCLVWRLALRPERGVLAAIADLEEPRAQTHR
ncbi:MAG: DUF2169 domain-containing protein [Myxococcales bacterium]|nr:DUF2169 domain-containing protein [Myxococcales bacterium]